MVYSFYSITPMTSQLPSFIAKLASVFNPLLTTLSNPRCRNEIADRFPIFHLSKIEIPEDKIEEDQKTATTPA